MFSRQIIEAPFELIENEEVYEFFFKDINLHEDMQRCQCGGDVGSLICHHSHLSCHSLSHYFQPSIAPFHLLATIFTNVLDDVPLYV